MCEEKQAKVDLKALDQYQTTVCDFAVTSLRAADN